MQELFGNLFTFITLYVNNESVSRMLKKSFLLFISMFILNCMGFPQQISDTTYNPVILKPEYKPGAGPLVFIDEGHHNFHTGNGRYLPFSRLLEEDGYVVKGYQGEFVKEKLEEGKILVIANALNEINVENWFLPTPSAFTKDEIETVKKWVMSGGSLFLIADHMPLAGAAMDLASVFGFEFSNGFALDTISRGPSFFKKNNNTLSDNIITSGRNESENVGQVVTFTGQAFKIPDDATPILIFDENYMNYLPDTAWQFHSNTTRLNVKGWSQGAFKESGKGRIVFFGEAAMFTAQLAGPQKIRTGMNSEFAGENYKLLLNIIHWLDRKL